MINLPPIGIPIMPNYIDSGTGMLILQVVIAGFIGGMVFLRNYLKNL